MLNIENYHRPSTHQEAFRLRDELSGSVVLGGCCYLRLGSRSIRHAIDLTDLSLDQIVETADGIRIGAMVSLRELETNPLTTSLAGGILPKCLEPIVGVQFRNCATIGGSVAGRYPFSDPIAALLALDAKLEMSQHGTVSLESFLEQKGFNDILLSIIVPQTAVGGSYQSVRKTKTDYPILNVAVVQERSGFQVVVGSRPSRAIRVRKIEEYLHAQGLHHDSAVAAGKHSIESIHFGDNNRASAQYRQAVCPVLITRSLLDIMEADNDSH